FFQAEDGIRDFHVTGVQTCALPISVSACKSGFRSRSLPLGFDENRTPAFPRASATIAPKSTAPALPNVTRMRYSLFGSAFRISKIGRASCRERVYVTVSEGAMNIKR